MNSLRLNPALFALLLFIFSPVVSAQTTAFTYQGRLTDAATAAAGTYDFQFAVYDAASGGTQQPQPSPITVTRTGVPVTNGVFTVQLDFGSSAFPGADRFLAISVKKPADADYTALTPRQRITSTPYALRAANATTADTATNSQQLGGAAADQFVQTTDARLSDARTPSAGSSFYIQNGTTPQASATFNIDGTGSANSFDAQTQYNIGGNRVFGVAGNGNSFVGVFAGIGNNSGTRNTFVGGDSGGSNASGGSNSFFGTSAGFRNTTGSENIFAGDSVGNNNTTGGNNSFFGTTTGQANTTGSNNTLVGHNANVNGSGDLKYAAAFGANAVVNANDTIVLGKTAGTYNGVARPADTVRIPGNLSVSGSITGTLPTGSGNYIQNATAQQTADFNVSGNGMLGGTLSAGTVNATGAYNIGSNRVLSAPGTNNLLAGSGTGAANLSGSGNSFFGNGASGRTTSGGSNTFFGNNAGNFNTVGSNNTAIGAESDIGGLNLDHATAIGTGVTVNESNTVAIGRFEDKTRINGPLSVNVTGNSNTGTLCLSSTQIVVLCSSSLRYKTNIAPFAGGLDFIKRLRPITYDWKDGSGRDVGFGAEDVAQVNSLFTVYNKDGRIEGIKYERFSALFVNAFKEQQTQIETLQTQLGEQRKRLAAQQNMIDGLRNLVCAQNPNAAVCK